MKTLFLSRFTIAGFLVCSLSLAFVPPTCLSAQDQAGARIAEPASPPLVSGEQESSLPGLTVPPEPRLSSDYVIGPEDVVEIEVFNVPELAKTVRVANDGTISLPLIGRVKAAGFTAREFGKELEAEWGKTYLQDPQVTVYVKEFHARPVSVIGAVEKPGLYQLTGRRSLIEMLSMAGGLAKRNSGTSGRTVVVTRAEGFADVQLVDGMQLVAADKLEINIRKLLYSHQDELNIPIKPFDIVSVTKADIVYVVGDVKKPGGFVLEDQEKVTVLQALALAEGANTTARKSEAVIIRRKADGSRLEIPLDVGKILKGKTPDMEMAANDILFVPMSSGKAAALRGAEAALGTLSGILIYRR